MKLTSKQRAYLRSLASNYDTIMQVGKGGITPNLVKTVEDALQARELIKLRTLENSEFSSRQAADAMAEATGAEVVTVIGTKFVLYKESKNHKKIFLDEISR
ncbi:MAG: ribosome assembly RNA-binding protein YhbY [Clostridia bacterium]|nr:ribosome assembly RNA-binding protein YhbY [Clostridia bacterium]